MQTPVNAGHKARIPGGWIRAGEGIGDEVKEIKR